MARGRARLSERRKARAKRSGCWVGVAAFERITKRVDVRSCDGYEAERKDDPFLPALRISFGICGRERFGKVTKRCKGGFIVFLPFR